MNLKRVKFIQAVNLAGDELTSVNADKATIVFNQGLVVITSTRNQQQVVVPLANVVAMYPKDPIEQETNSESAPRSNKQK